MKTTVLLLLLALGASTCPLTAQDAPKPGGGDSPRETETFTADQKAKVKDILSKYDATTLTADQAKAIHESFRNAGLRGGAALNDAVQAAGFAPDKLRDLAPPPSADGEQAQNGDSRPEPGDHGQQGNYTISQAISDRAQLSTIAFSGLAFLTGDFGAATFMPPGKVCDFFGFQYMRDVDAAGKGHNPMFLTRVASDVLSILNDNQRQMFADLAAEQAPQFEQLAYKRMPLIEAFQREKDGKIPAGSSGLNREAVIRYVGDFYVFDAELSYRRAEVFGKVIASLTPEQKAAFAKMKFGDFNTWPDLDERDALKRPNPTSSRFFTGAYRTYASEFFSWYAGSVEADTYFCPERHGTYFGSFYMKDMPAMNKRNYDISTAVTGDSGETFVSLLTADQRANVTSIPKRQKKLMAETVETRQAISVELRKFLTGGRADKAKVLALGRRYGELDGEMSWIYATAFAKVGQTLTAEQRAAFVKLRNLDGYHSAPGYLYSNPLPRLPALPSSDFLFRAPTQTSATPSAAAAAPVAKKGAFITLRSSTLTDGGSLPVEYTGDGASSTPPLEWSGAPAGTKSYAVIMHHIDPEGKTKWYWTLYNIPAGVTSLPKNVKDVGTLGNNSVNGRAGYAPPHSKGPGAKTYVLTVYALSSPLDVTAPADQVTREVLLGAMKDKILASSELKVVYDRTAIIGNAGEGDQVNDQPKP